MSELIFPLDKYDNNFIFNLIIILIRDGR